MNKAKYEHKFIVIPDKYLLDKSIPKRVREEFANSLLNLRLWLKPNRYYVCNQDEPYAKKVLKIILKSETKKLK